MRTKTFLEQQIERLRREQRREWERPSLHLPVPPPQRERDRERTPDDEKVERGVFTFDMRSA